jgi:integrase
LKVRLTPGFIEKIKAPATGRALYWDTQHRGLGYQVTHRDARTYVVQYRLPGGRSRRMALGGAHSLKEAIDQWKSITGDVAKGRALRVTIDPLGERQRVDAEQRAKASPNTLQALAEEFLRKHKHLRRIESRRAVLQRLVYPLLGRHQVADIRKSDVKRLIDQVAAENGPTQANMVLAYVRRLLTWYAEQSDDDYKVPILSKLAQPKKARDRILTDGELEALWSTATSYPGPFGRYLQFVLLTATRKREASEMRWNEVQGVDWVIPSDRYKTGQATLIPLSGAARAILKSLPRFKDCPYVFTHDGRRPLSVSAYTKSMFEQECGVTEWTVHDLRRTARTLMSRAKADADHSERAMGHVIGGVRSTYDLWEYRDEKLTVFEALAALIEKIANPATTEVLKIPA